MIETQDYITRNTRKAIRLTRRLPSGRSTRSWFGGLPTLPESLEWPRFPDYDCLLPFLAQVDLRDLPRVENSPLPEDGVLFFFYGISNLTGDAHHSVLYAVESDAVPFEEVAMPPNTSLVGKYEIYYPRPYDYFEVYRANPDFPAEILPRCLPKFELDMDVVANIRYPSDQERAALSDPDALNRAIDIANHEFHHKYAHDKSDPEYAHLGLPVGRGRDRSDWHVSSTDWPWAWIVVELVVRRLFYLESSFDVNRTANLEVRARLYREASEWLEKALAGGRFAPVPTEQRRQFRTWVSELEVALLRDKGISEQRIDEVMSEIGYLGSRFAWWCLPPTRGAVALLLDARQANRTLLPDTAVAACAPWINGVQTHRILGVPSESQHPPENHYDNVLLLQMGTDYGMLVQWGDMCALQFSITEADLRARRFDRAYVWRSG